MRGAKNGRGLLMLLALTIVLVVVSMEADAFLHKLFKGPDNAEEGNKSADRAKPGAIDYDSDSDSEDEPDQEQRRPPSSTLASRRGDLRRIDSSATPRTNSRASELAASQLRRAKVRRSKDSSRAEGKNPQGRTLRNQLRHAGKPANSYLDDEADWHQEDSEDEQETRRVRNRDKPRDEMRRPKFDGDKAGKRPKSRASVEDESEGSGNRIPSVYDDEFDGDEDDDDHDANSRGKPKKDALAKAKYVPTSSSKNQAAREELLSRISLSKPARVANQDVKQRADKASSDGKRKKEQKGIDLVSKKFWKKSLNSVAEATNKGFKATKKALAELPKDVTNMVDSVNTYLELDNKGKINAMDKRVAKAAKLVRSEFSQFTIEWARIMEEALDYLGDKDLDKVTWDDSDELDLRKDALHSLVIGYEFIRLMIIWRENMLLAHEGFRLWLEKAKRECEEDKSLDIMTDFGYTPDEVYNYFLLMAWDFIKFDGLEPQLNLDYLMELEDSRPKNYMSKFFRHIVIDQEIYFPTMRALEEERKAVRLPSEDQAETYDFFMEFRQMVAEGRVEGIDIEAPKELAAFVSKMTPQLRLNQLVYSKSHLKSLAAKMEHAKQNRQRGLASILSEGGDSDDEDDDLYDSDYED